ncbi:MAG: ribosome small subunit-dependent GTPase A [Lachnospiraceae bacterium]|nr:ribosome small subunit-dependent GTPase A [Lachnospiraceae bacterium]
MDGRIIKGIGGFYYVAVKNGEIYECRARGLFRKDRVKPLVGDNCRIDIIDKNDKTGNITDILPRKNELIRPNVANIDQALIVFAIKQPDPNFVMLDKLIIQYEKQDIPVVIVINKDDLADERSMREIADIYAGSGCKLIFTSAKEGDGTGELKECLKDRTTSVAGPSGTGKSSLINCLIPDASLKTGEISKKAERGKHTTRHSEIFPLFENTYIMDTPGFSSFDVYDADEEELKDYYHEFDGYDNCRFVPCSHTHEPGCLIKDAVQSGKINRVRYDNYCAILNEILSAHGRYQKC